MPALSRERTGLLLFANRIRARVIRGLAAAGMLAAAGPFAAACGARKETTRARPGDSGTVSSAGPVTDDLGRPVRLARRPARIVSLVPAATELLYALGAGDRLVGRTVWDDEPPEVRSVPEVGDGLRADLERVLARRPDLVVLHAGPDDRLTADRLRDLGVPAFAVRLDGLEDLWRNAERLGRLVDRGCAAERLVAGLRADLARTRALTAGRRPVRVYYDVAWPPSITVGGGSYLTELIEVAGGRNVFGDLAAPSPRVDLEALVARAPDVVLLPVSRGAPPPAAPASRPGWMSLAAVRERRVVEVDADLLHRPGPRVARAARELARALHPELLIPEASSDRGAAAGRVGADCP